MSIPGRVAYTAGSIKVLVDAGVVRPIRPDRLLLVLQTLARWGRSAAAGTITLAARYPDENAIIDELGTLTYAELHTRTNALAHSLSDMGIGEGDGVAIMCRNHRGFIEATVAVSKLGADALYLNTAFAGPQLTEVVGREKPKAIVYDEEFGDLLADAARRRKRVVAWHDSRAPGRPHARRAHHRRLVERLETARARGSKRHPHERHDRLAQGRVAGQPPVTRSGGVAAVEDPAAHPPGRPHRGAALSFLGLRALFPRPHPRLDLRAAAEVRSRGRPGRGVALPLRLAGGGARDDAADHGAARGHTGALRPLLAQGGGGQRLGPAWRPRARLDGRRG